ncbi:MAG: patatin-like phospholipase family protein [Stellaceae bacterium]
MKSVMNSLDRRRLLQLTGACALAVGSAGVAAARAQAQPAGAPQFIILACDGGGVRGVITALLLHDLNPALLQKVSLFAGTSTGSIIALGLAAGVSTEQILNLYRSMYDCRSIPPATAGWPAPDPLPPDRTSAPKPATPRIARRSPKSTTGSTRFPTGGSFLMDFAMCGPTQRTLLSIRAQSCPACQELRCPRSARSPASPSSRSATALPRPMPG